MAEKIISREKENFIKRCAKGIGYWLMGSFMCFCICSTMVVLMKGVLLLKIFVALCTSAIMLGLYFNWAYYSAKRDRNAVKFHKMEYDRFMPLKMAIAAPIVSYVMLILLYLCKLGTIHESFFSYYLFFDMWILPYITLFTGERVISAVSWSGMFGITIVTLLQPAVIYLTYTLVYNDVDVAGLVFYKNGNKRK